LCGWVCCPFILSAIRNRHQPKVSQPGHYHWISVGQAGIKKTP
jgi:hypothetical protein